MSGSNIQMMITSCLMITSERKHPHQCIVMDVQCGVAWCTQTWGSRQMAVSCMPALTPQSCGLKVRLCGRIIALSCQDSPGCLRIDQFMAGDILSSSYKHIRRSTPCKLSLTSAILHWPPISASMFRNLAFVLQATYWSSQAWP